MVSGICTPSCRAPVLGAFSDPQVWGAGRPAESDRYVGVLRERFECVLHRSRQRHPGCLSLVNREWPGLGEASQQAHYRVGVQHSHEDRCRQALR